MSSHLNDFTKLWVKLGSYNLTFMFTINKLEKDFKREREQACLTSCFGLE